MNSSAGNEYPIEGACLSGTWSLVLEESDDVHGLEKVRGMPLAVMLTNSVHSWLSITQQATPGDIEEIIMSCRSVRTETRAYQIGKLNYECVSAGITAGFGDTVLAFLSVDALFHELHVVRVGNFGHRSEETYSLMEGGEYVSSRVSICLKEGDETQNFKRKYHRCADTPAPWPLQFVTSRRSLGWNAIVRSCGVRSVIKSIQISYLPSVSIQTPNDGVPLGESYYAKDPQDIRLTLAGSVPTTRHLVTKRFGDKISNGEQVTMYRIQCRRPSGDNWVIIHRYREFHALKMFVDQWTRKKAITPPLVFPDIFPNRTMSKKNVPLVLGASRYTGLQSFLDTVVKWIGDGGGNEDIVDVLYSFLEVPEDLSLLPPDVTEAFQSEHNDSHSHIQPNVANTIGKQSTSHVVTKNNINSVDAGRIDRIPAVIPTDNITDAALESSVKAINALLCNGLLITKHGRTGTPKKRILLCNRMASRLYWIPPPATNKSGLLSVFTSSATPSQLQDNKSILLMHVTDVRRGVDSDPFDIDKLATPNLRRSCSSNKWPKCISLITYDRYALKQGSIGVGEHSVHAMWKIKDVFQSTELIMKILMLDFPFFVGAHIPESKTFCGYAMLYSVYQIFGFCWAFVVNVSFSIACSMCYVVQEKESIHELIHILAYVYTFYCVLTSVRIFSRRVLSTKHYCFPVTSYTPLVKQLAKEVLKRERHSQYFHLCLPIMVWLLVLFVLFLFLLTVYQSDLCQYAKNTYADGEEHMTYSLQLQFRVFVLFFLMEFQIVQYLFHVTPNYAPFSSASYSVTTETCGPYLTALLVVVERLSCLAFVIVAVLTVIANGMRMLDSSRLFEWRHTGGQGNRDDYFASSPSFSILNPIDHNQMQAYYVFFATLLLVCGINIAFHIQCVCKHLIIVHHQDAKSVQEKVSGGYRCRDNIDVGTSNGNHGPYFTLHQIDAVKSNMFMTYLFSLLLLFAYRMYYFGFDVAQLDIIAVSVALPSTWLILFDVASLIEICGVELFLMVIIPLSSILAGIVFWYSSKTCGKGSILALLIHISTELTHYCFEPKSEEEKTEIENSNLEKCSVSSPFPDGSDEFASNCGSLGTDNSSSFSSFTSLQQQHPVHWRLTRLLRLIHYIELIGDHWPFRWIKGWLKFIGGWLFYFMRAKLFNFSSLHVGDFHFHPMSGLVRAAFAFIVVSASLLLLVSSFSVFQHHFNYYPKLLSYDRILHLPHEYGKSLENCSSADESVCGFIFDHGITSVSVYRKKPAGNSSTMDEGGTVGCGGSYIPLSKPVDSCLDYAACQWRWHNLTLIDFALFSEIAYLDFDFDDNIAKSFSVTDAALTDVNGRYSFDAMKFDLFPRVAEHLRLIPAQRHLDPTGMQRSQGNNFVNDNTNKSNFADLQLQYSQIFTGDGEKIFLSNRTKIALAYIGPYFLEIRNVKDNYTIIAIRGTDLGRLHDLLEDMKLYSEAITYHLLSYVFPTIRMWSPAVTSICINWLYMFNSFFGLPSESVYYRPLVHHVMHLKDQMASQGKNHSIILCGHSLGGGLANIVGALTSVSSISFSPPGIGYSYRKYHTQFSSSTFCTKDTPVFRSLSVKEDELHRASVAVVTDTDVVSNLDYQVGMIQRISCDAKPTNYVSCHSLEATIDNLVHHCECNSDNHFYSSRFGYHFRSHFVALLFENVCMLWESITSYFSCPLKALE